MKQLTLVAFYGQKTDAFSELIHEICGKIQHPLLKGIFIPYEKAQIHMTITGLEKRIGFDEHYNANIWKKEGENRSMIFEGLYQKLSCYFPIDIQIGGFGRKDYPFTSFGRPLDERSFGIDPEHGSVNLIGWSVHADKTENTRLLDLRKSLYTENHIRHAYHHHNDNDFYMVLGKLRDVSETHKEALIEAQREIRDHLVQRTPFKITLTLENLFLVQYEKNTLEPASSKAWNIQILAKHPDFIEKLYRDTETD